MDDNLQKVNAWFDNVNRALPAGMTIVPGPNYPAGAPRPLPNDIRELLVQADAAIEKSRALLKRARARIHVLAGPYNTEAALLVAEITDLLGD